MASKILGVQELREMSLSEVKMAYLKLTKLYARRMYEREKENKELFEAVYGKRLTQGQMYNEFLKQTDADLVEKNKYIAAYQSLAKKMGGATGGSKVHLKNQVKLARQNLGKRAVNMTDREAIVAFSEDLVNISEFDDWYSWYEALVKKYGAVIDKSEAGRMSQQSGFEAVEKEFQDRSNKKSVESNVPADLLGKIG